MTESLCFLLSCQFLLVSFFQDFVVFLVFLALETGPWTHYRMCLAIPRRLV